MSLLKSSKHEITANVIICVVVLLMIAVICPPIPHSIINYKFSSHDFIFILPLFLLGALLVLYRLRVRRVIRAEVNNKSAYPKL